MNELFTIPATAPDRLSAARRRYETAQHAYDEAVRIDEECDGFGETAYRKLRDEVAAARYELSLAERERMTP